MATTSFREPDDSPVGQTTTSSIQISADDGTVFPATVYTGINVDDDPQLREKLVDGTLNVVASPGDDDRTYEPAVPVTYHNEEKKLFALVIPEQLRHEEFECRQQLLERLRNSRTVVPDYMRRFEVVFDAAQIKELESGGDATGSDRFVEQAQSQSPDVEAVRERLNKQLDERDEEMQTLSQRLDERDEEIQTLSQRLDERDGEREERDGEIEERDSEIEELHTQLDELRGDFDEQRQQLEAELDERQSTIDELQNQLAERQSELEELRQNNGSQRESAQEFEERLQQLDERAEKLDVREEQLEEVADRVERESARVDEARQQLESEQAELEHQRQKLSEKQRKIQVRELNFEQRELQAQQGGDANEEGTQVVTDDQFIEVVETDEDDAGLDETSAQTIAEARPEPEGPADPPPAAAGLEEHSGASRREPAVETIFEWEPGADFKEVQDFDANDRSRFVKATDDLVVAGYQLNDERALAFADDTPTFLFQFHELDGVPVASLTLAVFDDDGHCRDAVAAPIGIGQPDAESILEQLLRDLHVHLVIYDDGGESIAAWEAAAPIRRNIEWAHARLENWHAANDKPDGFDATDALAEHELVGAMHHPFDSQSFVEFDGAADVSLAVSIVGYWSEPEQFEYLIGNRSFSLEAFRQIQQRVVRQALHWGIVPGVALRQIAIEDAIIVDEKSLVERLLSNFAEVCVGLRPNDLDPIEQWENWDELIQLAEAQGITPDAEVLELAEASLERAEEYEAIVDEERSQEPVDAVGEPVEGGIDVTASTTSRRAEKSAVTYFIPVGSDGDKQVFDDLMDSERRDVEDAIDEEQCPEIAAQVLLERFGPGVVAEILENIEDMDEARLFSVARFVEARADELEAGLMQALDASGPAGTFVAARALAAIESTAAIPRLLEAVCDPSRRNDGRRLAGCLARFGDKLVAPLSRALEESPDDEALLTVLDALENVRPGTVDELSESSSQALQQALDSIRQQA